MTRTQKSRDSHVTARAGKATSEGFCCLLRWAELHPLKTSTLKPSLHQQGAVLAAAPYGGGEVKTPLWVGTDPISLLSVQEEELTRTHRWKTMRGQNLETSCTFR